MTLRSMGYMARIWAAWRAEHGDAASLPAIVPVVLYHGDRAWDAPVDLADLVDVPPELEASLAPLLPSVRIRLLDLSALSDGALRAGALLLEVALWSFEHVWDPDFFEGLEQWRDHLEAICRAPTGLQAVEQVIRYWMSAARHVPKDARERLVRALPAPVQEAGMTLADELRREGRVEGHLEGRREGEVETLRWALESQLQARFGAVPGEAQARIAAAAAPALRRWLLALVSAPTLDAVFREDAEPSA